MLAQNYCVATVQPVASDSPPDCRIYIGSTPSSLPYKKKDRLMAAFLFGAGYGSRTRPVCLGSRNSTDKLTLQIFTRSPALTGEGPSDGIIIARCRRICNRNPSTFSANISPLRDGPGRRKPPFFTASATICTASSPLPPGCRAGRGRSGFRPHP